MFSQLLNDEVLIIFGISSIACLLLLLVNDVLLLILFGSRSNGDLLHILVKDGVLQILSTDHLMLACFLSL